jgi:hypothetical protein
MLNRLIIPTSTPGQVQFPILAADQPVFTPFLAILPLYGMPFAFRPGTGGGHQGAAAGESPLAKIISQCNYQLLKN